MLKLSQMTKIYCRLRFFDINFGVELNTYFDFSSKKFDPASSRSQKSIVEMNNKYYGNLMWKKVALDIYEVNPIRIIIYAASWVLKIILTVLLINSKDKGLISKPLAHLI